jgi:CheY-like chemotaxis protein
LFVGLLSHAVRQAFSGTVVEVKVSNSEPLSIEIRYLVSRVAEKQQMVGDMVIQLIHRLNWQLDINPIDNDFQCIKITRSGLRTKVLIVDDNEGLVELLSRILTGQAYSVYSTSKSSECLHLAKEILPDVIILDVMMPDMDGWDLLQRLKIDPQTKKIHVIICSVFKEPELAKSLGASAFLPKPIRQSELLATIRQFDLR